ncbi:MAG: hypothetical protein IPJ15_03710 [Actinomycetales bacterium]|nr:hypothetical protein [Candidatus Phosphoribacter baldrii]
MPLMLVARMPRPRGPTCPSRARIGAVAVTIGERTAYARRRRQPPEVTNLMGPVEHDPRPFDD